jgi:4-amino-4-deoxy-L-arabinose transferase-like glycosyltransferase
MELATLRRPRLRRLPAVRVPATLARIARSPAWAALALVLLAAHFRLGGLAASREDYFYDAAVRSMSLCWHNFFYGAFDPSGRLAVDKPPVDLWLQVASVKLLGFSARSLVLPAALAGTLAVPLLYDAVRRLFGTLAGICAGGALAVMPVSVVASRSDALDALMMALAVLALWLVVLAVQRGRVRYLYLAAVVMGLDFNVKLFEALVALQALFLLWMLGSRAPARRRIGHAAGAGALFVLVALSWAIAVSLSPAHSRPYPIGSSNGSVWNVIFVYNGLHRLSPPARAAALHSHVVASAAPGRPPLLGGLPGVWVGAELVAALAFGLLAVIAAGRPRRRGLPLAGTIAIGVWLVVGTLLFNHMTNLRVRYLEAFTPAVAVALGAGAALLAGSAARGRATAAAALAAGLVAVPVALHRLTTPPTHGPGSLAIAAGAAAAALALTVALGVRFVPSGRRLASLAPLPIAALALVSLLANPVSTSARLVRQHASDAGTGSPLPAYKIDLVQRFLLAHRGSTKYEFGAAAPAKAAPLIARDAQPALVLTSYRGHDVVTPAQVKAAVLAGQVRWFLMDHACSPSTPAGCAPSVQWVAAHGRDVTRAAGIQQGRGTLLEVTPTSARAPARVHGRTTRRHSRRKSARSARNRRDSRRARHARRRRS